MVRRSEAAALRAGSASWRTWYVVAALTLVVKVTRPVASVVAVAMRCHDPVPMRRQSWSDRPGSGVLVP